MISLLLLVRAISVPVATMRERPEEGSAIASQAIFSEQVRVLESHDLWIKIATLSDQRGNVLFF